MSVQIGVRACAVKNHLALFLVNAINAGFSIIYLSKSASISSRELKDFNVFGILPASISSTSLIPALVSSLKSGSPVSGSRCLAQIGHSSAISAAGVKVSITLPTGTCGGTSRVIRRSAGISTVCVMVMRQI